MKLSVEILIEVIEIKTTFNLNDELWIVMCYSAMLCICWLDQQYYYAITDEHMKIKFSMEAECCLPIIKKPDQEGNKYDDSFLASLGPFASKS